MLAPGPPGWPGRLEVAGKGPLVICVPGMGDLRATYRLVAPILREGGYRVAGMDLRGHGDSDATFFSSYGDTDTADDLIALIEALHGPAVIVGNLTGVAAAALAAAQRPDLVSGLVLISPFLRETQVSAPTRLAFPVALTPRWAATVWKHYLHRPSTPAANPTTSTPTSAKSLPASASQDTPGPSPSLHAPATPLQRATSARSLE
jgi:pimeloyl-ACP methyl ester carboxylesterase